MKYRVKCLIIFVLVNLSLQAFSQSTLVRVLDKHTGDPVPYSYVFLESLDGKVKSDNLTDDKGEVSVTFDRRARISVSELGYTGETDTIDPVPSYTFYIEPAPAGLNEVVVTAQFTPQRSDKSIYKVNVISGIQIEQKAAQDLRELLSTELNIRSTQDNILGAGLSIQGLTGENVKILIDGVPVIGRQNGIIDLSQINLANVDHVEIVEGPMSVIYGSNALAGAVNIITRDNSKSIISGRVNTYYESVGVYNGNMSFSARHNNSSLSLSGGRNFFGGFSTDRQRRSMLWDPKEQYNADILYQYNNKRIRSNVEGTLFTEQLRNLGDLSPDFSFEKAFDEYHFTRRYDIRTTGSWKNSSGSSSLTWLTAFSHYDKIKRTYLKNLVDLTKTLAADASMHDTSSINSAVLRGIYYNRTGAGISFQTGFDIDLESGSGKRMDGSKAIYDYAVFLSSRYDPFPSLSLQPGLRIIYNTKYRAPIVWSLSAKWDPLKSIRLRVSAGKGFRSPSLKELYLDFRDSNHNVTGNADLKSETSLNINGSADYSLDLGRSSFHFDVKSYYNKIRNKIDLLYDPVDPTGAKYMNIPGNNFVTKGLSFSLQYELSPWFLFNAGINFNGKSRLEDLSEFTWSENVASGFSYKNLKYKLNLSLSYKYTGAYKDYRGEFTLDNQVASISQVYMNDYSLMDLTLSRSFFKDRINLATGVKNLFNVVNVYSVGGGSSVHGSDSSNESSVGWGRTFFIKASWSFDKY